MPPDFTFTVTVAEAARIRTAVGRYLGLAADATAQQCKDLIIKQVKAIVRSQERAIAESAVAVAADIEPT